MFDLVKCGRSYEQEVSMNFKQYKSNPPLKFEINQNPFKRQPT